MNSRETPFFPSALSQFLPSARGGGTRGAFLRLLACGLLAVLSSPGRAELLDDLSRDAARYPVVRAEFEQTKRMAAMKRPLVTRGKMTFSRTQGVLWEIVQPYRMSYVLGETRIAEIGEDGARRVREARDVPGLAQVGRIFQSLFSASPDALREHFNVAARGSAAQWTLELEPRQEHVARFLKGLRLSGRRFVEEIRIEEASGDETRIVFSHSQGGDAPTGDEARLFGEP